jgi:hypothetical protein
VESTALEDALAAAQLTLSAEELAAAAVLPHEVDLGLELDSE